MNIAEAQALKARVLRLEAMLSDLLARVSVIEIKRPPGRPKAEESKAA